MTTYSAVKVEPVNLELLTKQEAQAIHQRFAELLNQADYTLQIHSRQEKLDLQNYTDHLEKQETENTGLKDDYLDYIHSLNKGDLAQTTHYIIVRVNEDKEEAAAEGSEFDRRLRQITSTLNTANLSAETLSGDKLNQFFEENKPSSTSSKKYVSTGDRYRRVLAVKEYPSNLELGWPLDLLRVDGKVDIIQKVEPQPGIDTVSKLNRLKQKASAEIDSRLSEGFLDTNKLKTQLDSVNWMLDQLADREQQPFNYSVYISPHAETQDRCDTVHNRVKSQLKKLGIDYSEPVYRTDHAAKTISPLRRDHLEENSLVLTESAAAGFPFATRPLQQGKGVIYGEDTQDQTPINVDRFQWDAPHLARFGATGSGKTFHTKIELLRTHLAQPQTQIIIVDPKDEYTSLVEKLEGGTRQVNDRPYSLGKVSQFTVPERGNTRHIDKIIELIEHLYKITSQRPGQKTLVVIDEAHNITADNTGRKTLTRWIREARDTQTALTLISQSAADFTEHPETRTLLDQVPGKLFFRHERVPDSIIDYFHLSDQEVIDIYDLNTGTDSPYSQAILKISNQLNAEIQIQATPTEQQVINQ